MKLAIIAKSLWLPIILALPTLYADTYSDYKIAQKNGDAGKQIAALAKLIPSAKTKKLPQKIAAEFGSNLERARASIINKIFNLGRDASARIDALNHNIQIKQEQSDKEIIAIKESCNRATTALGLAQKQIAQNRGFIGEREAKIKDLDQAMAQLQNQLKTAAVAHEEAITRLNQDLLIKESQLAEKQKESAVIKSEYQGKIDQLKKHLDATQRTALIRAHLTDQERIETSRAIAALKCVRTEKELLLSKLQELQTTNNTHLDKQ